MIQWIEQPPDFRHFPLGDLFTTLSFTAALQLIAGESTALRVVVSSTVMGGIYTHLSQQNIEMGGLLVGRVFKDDDTFRVVLVEAFVPSSEFRGTGVSLRMGTSLWDEARIAQTSGQSVIGWYHSHPNLGAFFSGTDRRTQAAFFTQAHSLGLVVDPIRAEEMWFSGPASGQLSASQVVSTP
ncbi:Mov34/MPN/PAD-1 family protein [Mesorhizobium sp. BR1-1-2]|uniref:Mov34/MPN/PAD-1 family protein n=1 Tax=Mesorhizobium sp. BR1-1-2 TaxID=2876652 RepID=UPI001CC99308|nr:Mov34/MPN/PAD-1 family protein [Mesorhizobium sp. BR1-1-2]MBZ9963732.1 Mov34/MPN/PAD-1 family protein [Mesorhizobium sp. BR1-1-2]